MQDADGPGTDAAWTQWKTLHHQTRDLSPWMTEAVSADHVRVSMRPENPPAYSVRASIPLQEARPIEQEEPRVGKHRIFWKRYIVAALVISILIVAIVPAAVITSRPNRPAPPAPSNTPTPSPPQRVQGIATFNNYTAQGNTVCSGSGRPTNADNIRRFAAAAGDISKDISTGLCEGSSTDMDFQYDTSICTANGGQYPPPTYQGPSCPTEAVRCGTCFRVENLGTYDSTSTDIIYGSVIVEIIDACPAGHAQNYCKTEVPRDERCGSNETNSLDIDVSAYKELTKGSGGSLSGSNLRINITLDVPCDSPIQS